MTSSTRTRRTQAERTAHTRRALLDATFEALVEVGFKGTTTAGVAQRAGVSMGALQNHFRTKTDLLTAAVAHVFDRRIEEFEVLLAEPDPAADKLDTAIALLWSMFSCSTFTAWHELWVAARTDPELAPKAIEIDRQFMVACERLYAEIFPSRDLTDSSLDARAGLHMVFALMSGLAMGRSIDGYEPYLAEEILGAFKSMLRPLVTTEPDNRSQP